MHRTRREGGRDRKIEKSPLRSEALEQFRPKEQMTYAVNPLSDFQHKTGRLLLLAALIFTISRVYNSFPSPPTTTRLTGHKAARVPCSKAQGQDSRTFIQPCMRFLSMMEHVRLCAVSPMENWLGSSLNQIQGWTAVR